MRTRPGRRA